ncbi:hypothetical protein MADA3029_p0007 [Vibrio nigripulchritudo MADA3029]|nr:hypothetical protein VIBNIMADA3020_p0007 [Vibrio nigripulchritudo MADA3020]CCN56643.1 hypothetical protein VIBNIMADA3021_p0007 [Vibrio nigripulchritudo MADA3021]CCN62500.1 hypothetical protein MADA3029_p0007 [Vibrio nigripulchritudo MADA3029]
MLFDLGLILPVRLRVGQDVSKGIIESYVTASLFSVCELSLSMKLGCSFRFPEVPYVVLTLSFTTCFSKHFSGRLFDRAFRFSRNANRSRILKQA